MIRYRSVILLSVVVLVAGICVGVAGGPKAAAMVPGPYPGAVLFRSDGTLRSAPATVHQPSFGHVAVVVGTNGGLWWSSDQTGWTSLGAPPVGVVGDPAAVSWGNGRIDVFVRGGDNRLWQIWTACGGCQWSAWLKPVGDDGTLASSPTATSWGPDRLDVFVLGTNGVIYQRFWAGSSWNGSWLSRGTPPPGAFPDRPGAASWGPGRIDLFVRGADNRLWQSYWAGQGWSGWLQPPGTQAGVLASAPSASPWGAGLPGASPRLTVFVRGTNGHVYQTTWDAAWSPWAPIGAPQDMIIGAPGVFTSLQFAPYILGRGTDNRAYAFYPYNPIGTALANFVATRVDNVTAVVYDINTGQTVVFQPGVVEHTASTVKVDILATLLQEAQAAGRPLTAQEQMLAVPMIEESLDTAADALWEQLGPAAIGAFERAAGMTQTVPATDGIWGTTTTTAIDRIAMLRQLVFPSSLLTTASRDYVLNLMEHITPSQAWGVSGGVPAGVTVALKNGFSIIQGWQINSMGWVDGQGRNYLIAVLTDLNPTEAYGIETINGMSSIVWNGLGP